MDIKCAYYDTVTYGYTCEIDDQRILPDAKLKFIGKHKNGKTNNDVKLIQFVDCNVLKVPKGLTKMFPNLEGMDIHNSGLVDINRSDFLEYKNFKWLFFNNNQIVYLPGDLFANCKKLEAISFSRNPLTIVDPNILDGLENLTHVNMNGKNINYGMTNFNYVALDNPKLAEIKEKRDDQYMITENPKTEDEKLRKDVEELTKLKSFYQTDEILKDFRININGKQFRVHKTFLAARSSYFADILRKTPQSKCLKLADISVDIFEYILKFLYTDELPQEANFMELFVTTELLKIDELNAYSAKKILEELDHENAPEILNLGNKYKHDGLKRKAFEEIKRKYSNIEFKEEWLNKDEQIEKIVEHLQKIQKIEKNLISSLACED